MTPQSYRGPGVIWEIALQPHNLNTQCIHIIIRHNIISSFTPTDTKHFTNVSLTHSENLKTRSVTDKRIRHG